MVIRVSSVDDFTNPGLLPAALAHLQPAIGPLRFRLDDGPGDLWLQAGPAGADWEPWQTLSLSPAASGPARIAARCGPDWYPTRESWVLAWTMLEATLRLLLGPENVPHPLPKTCLNHRAPHDRVEAFTLIRGGYICKSCCEALQARGLASFALDQLQEATQLVRAGLIRPQLYRPRPGRLRLVERQGQLVAELPDYGPDRLPLEPLQLALYVLLLRRPAGLATAPPPGQLEGLAQELAGLYRQTSASATPEKARQKAVAALRPARLSELTSFLNACLSAHVPAAVAGHYRVETHTPATGQKLRRIALPRELVEDLTAGRQAG